jgi:hypothetical protein
MFRSFILRMALILSSTAALCFLLMALTLGIQKEAESMQFSGILFAVMLVWVPFNWYIVRKTDPELTVEVARLVLPAGAVLSIVLSGLLSLYLDGMLPGEEGKQHMILPFVGFGIAIFLFIRCLDIKWLRGEAEIVMLEERGR